MWRATVVERLSPGRVSVKIPKLYPKGIVKDIQASFDAQVGQRVIVADLHPDARVHDWWVVGRESELGIWGTPYPHEHPIGQVTGLTDVLDAKADTTDLTGYATTTALSDGLSTKVNSSTYTTGMSGKADVPGDWVNCSLSTYLTLDTAAGSPAMTVRNTPLGMQIRGRYRLTSAVPMDAVIFTLPASFTPTHPILLGIPTMGPGSAYASLTYGMEIQTNRTVTARQDMLSGARLTFNQIITL